MIFKPTEGSDILELKPYFDRQMHRSCDNTIGVAFQWGEHYGTEFAISEDIAYLRDKDEDGYTYIVNLSDGKADKTLSRLEEYVRQEGGPFVILAMTQEEVDVLKAYYPERIVSVEHDGDADDYLYEIEKLQTFSGKKLHGQRNHFNHFRAEFPDYQYEEITEDNMEQAETFLDHYRKDADITEEIKVYELKRARLLLQNMFRLGLKGGFIRAGGRIVALAIGEVQKDTLFVHVEKAFASVTGAFQAIVSEFALHAPQPDTIYCNREDDAGDEGLRKSKQDYHPCAMVEKYRVEIKLD